MNKILAIVAVVLSLATAFYIVGLDGPDGAVPFGAQYISDADVRTYSDSDLTSDIICITSATVMEDAFRGCGSIMEVYATETTSIGAGAFEGCTGLCYLEAKKLISIGERAFKDTGLGQVKFSDALTTIGAYAFQGCTARTQAILTGTGVTELADGVFKNSSVKIEDLRNISSVSPTAFEGCSLIGQIIREGQTAKLEGVTEIIADGLQASGFITKQIGSEYFLYVGLPNKNIVLSCTDYRGIIEYNSKTLSFYTMTKGCEISYGCSEMRIAPRATTISFPGYLSMDPVVHLSGEGTYTLPSPAIASSMFEGWSIHGESGSVSTITEARFQELGSAIALDASFGTRSITFDHSQVSGITGASSLPAGMTFTVNDAYPSLDDIEGYAFLGWSVGGELRTAGAKITTYSNHTATSVWGATAFTVSLIGFGGTAESSWNVSPGSPVELSDLSVTVPEGKLLKGWSLSEGGLLLSNDPVISANTSIYAVFEDRPTHTVTFRDNGETVGTLSGYEGDSVTIVQANPESESHIFQYWTTDGSDKYYKDDSMLLVSDATLDAVWKAKEVKLSYYHVTEEKVTYSWGDVVTIGTQNASKQGFTLLGWSYTYNGPVDVAIGGTVTMNGDRSLYAIWKENDKCRIAMHHHNGDSTVDTVESGSTYTIRNGIARELASFDGWSLTQDGTVNYVSGDTLTVSADMDLYEIWTISTPIPGPQIPEPSTVEEPSNVPEEVTTTEEPQKEADPVPAPVEESKDAEPQPIQEEPPAPANDTPAESPSEQQPAVEPSETPVDDKAPETTAELKETKESDAPATVPPATETPGQTVPEVKDTEDVAYDIPKKTSKSNSDAYTPKYTLRLRDGSTSLLTKTLGYGDVFDLGDVNVPERTGYMLLGWSYTKNSSDADLAPDSEVDVYENTTLYTVWEKLIAVTFHNDGTIVSELVKKGSMLTLEVLEDPSRVFKGWSTSTDGDILGTYVTANSDVHLYAVWGEIPAKDPETEDKDDKPQETDDADDRTHEQETVPPAPSGQTSETKSGGGINLTYAGVAAVAAAITSVMLVMYIRKS